MGNYHEPFLGEGDAATYAPLPDKLNRIVKCRWKDNIAAMASL